MAFNKKAGEKFVRQCLADKESYILNGEKDDVFYQFEYKVRKSKAVENLELLEKGLVEVPRWTAYFAAIASIFIAAFFVASLVTLGNVVSKPDAMYQQSCSDRPCSKALNLKCINKTCQCESPKYYTKKCVDLSKYGERCMFTSHCITGQSLSCMGSICSCALNKYWSSDVSLCVDRLTYGEACNGDQCKINSNLICGSSGSCDCVDNTLYYWSESSSACVAKKKYSQSCTVDNECLNSQLTICKNDLYCLCTDTQYFNGVNCVNRVSEFEACTFDDMCLMPMTCSSGKCSCASLYYYDSTIPNCVPQLPYSGVTCYSDHHCREDYKLFCSSGTCLCKSSYTWSSTANICRYTYNQGTCSSLSPCNSDEGLMCATSSNKCNCPEDSSAGKCDCVRVTNNEKFWDLDNLICTNSLPYLSACTEDYMCKTLTELTKCINGECNCEQVGGFTSSNKCKKCKDDEFYFNDKCYFFSTETIRGKNADSTCKNRNRGRALVIETIEEQEWIELNAPSAGPYWISGRRRRNWSNWFSGSYDYSWGPVNSRLIIDSSICSLTRDKDCLYFLDGCYKGDRDCDDNNREYPYICEY
ncbi:unnamed protein product [Brachionus calyciflorus]|uniref:C-type lectin domain-containing protein n=1 Tax=Brachionus calyciflorus TaxID=104777 RepID=A0A814DYH3_9BILA|nr:unnamed protein product [Brachionus calyciflorus]